MVHKDDDTPLAWEDAFIEHFRDSGVVRSACQHAGVSRQQVQYHRKKSRRFEERYQAAFEDSLDLIEGWLRTWSEGQDPATARWYLSKHRPHIYGDQIAVEHKGNVAPVYPPMIVRGVSSEEGEPLPKGMSL